ncbi:MAG TPA: OmpH family outer membrane protein [Candidatus Binatia bacterium]
MHKVLAVVFFLVAAAPAWGQQVKIGLVDLPRAVLESQQGKLAKDKLQAQVKKAEADMIRERQEIEKAKADFDKKAPLLKDDDRRKMEGELQKRIVNYQRGAQDLQNDLGQKQRDAEAAILKDLEGVVTEIGKNEKFTFILERSQLLYSDQAIDITAKVIELYNSRTAGAAKAAKGK